MTAGMKMCSDRVFLMGEEEPQEGCPKKQYQRWKTLVPFLYDFFTHSNLAPWPSYSCR